MLDQGGTHIEVFCNRPSKRGREIFGGLVPSTKCGAPGPAGHHLQHERGPARRGPGVLPAGTYTLWTIPDHGVDRDPERQDVPWGVSWGEGEPGTGARCAAGAGAGGKPFRRRWNCSPSVWTGEFTPSAHPPLGPDRDRRPDGCPPTSIPGAAQSPAPERAPRIFAGPCPAAQISRAPSRGSGW